MLEFEKSLEELNKAMEESRKGFKEGWKGYENSLEAYNTARRQREEILQAVLEEKGLGVCSEVHFYSGVDNPEDWKLKSAEELGIYPKSELKIRYVQGVSSDHDHFTMEDSEHRISEVRLLCPEHFAYVPVWIYGTLEVPKFTSEVVKKDGRYVLVENGADITRLVEKGGSYNSRVEPEGKKFPDLSVYRFMGIPNLPNAPDVDFLRRDI